MINLGDMLAINVSRPTITVAQVGPGEICVTVPVGEDLSTEWVLRTYPATGVWGVWSVRGLVRGVPIQLTEEGSTMEYAFQVGRTADAYSSGVTYDFVGGGHGSEVLLAASFALDGKPLAVSLSSGAELVVSQVIATKMPKGLLGGATIGTTHLRHRFTAVGLQVEHSHAISTPDLSYRTAYGAMLPAAKAAVTHAQCDDGPVVALRRAGAIPLTGLRGNTYRLWHTDTDVNPFVMTMTLDAPEISGIGWSLAAPPAGWLYDRADYSKWYVDWVGDSKQPAQSSIHRQAYSVLVVG